MSQAEIMKFLDKHPGELFSAKDIFKNIKKPDQKWKTINTNVYAALNKIVRRKEYQAIILPVSNKSDHTITLYGAKNG